MSDLGILMCALAFLVGCLSMAVFVLVGAMRQLKTEANGLLKHIESVKRQCLSETQSVEKLVRVNIEKADARYKNAIEMEQRLWDETKAMRSKIEDVNNRAAAMAIKR